MQKIYKGIKNYWYDETKCCIEWGILTIILLFCFLTMNYNDLLITANHGIVFLEEIFAGNLFHIYDNFDGAYGMTLYLVFGIWSIPVWIIKLIVQESFQPNTMAYILWYKLLVAVFVILTAKKIKEIGYIYGIKGIKSRWVTFSFMSSIILVLPSIALAQYDIIALFFILCGIKSYLTGDTKRFLAYFAFAIPMKYFAIFVFLPLVLLKEKRLIRIGIQLLCGGSIVVLCKLFLKGSSLATVNTFVFGFFDNMVQPGMNISIYVMIFGLLCVFAYVLENNQENILKYTIYLSFASYAVFFMFTTWNSYWIVLLAPFLVLIIFNNGKYFKVNLLLEMLATLTIIIKKTHDQPWVLGGGETFQYLVLKDSGGRNIRIDYLLDLYGIVDLMTIIYSVSLGCFLALLLLNFPAKVKQNNIGTVNIERGLMWIRLAILIGWVLLQTIVVFVL